MKIVPALQSASVRTSHPSDTSSSRLKSGAERRIVSEVACRTVQPCGVGANGLAGLSPHVPAASGKLCGNTLLYETALWRKPQGQSVFRLQFNVRNWTGEEIGKWKATSRRRTFRTPF